MAEREAQGARPGRPPSRGRRASVRADPSERIATIVSWSLDAPDAVAVPGNTVAPVAVEAQAGGDERLAELVGVVPAQGVAGLDEQRVGERLVRGVELRAAGGRRRRSRTSGAARRARARRAAAR